jgi:hypothetical protein
VPQKKINYVETQYWCIADTNGYRKPGSGPLSVTISSASGNPLQANGTVSNAGFGTSITVCLTDSDGDRTYGNGTLSPPADPTSWSASFNPMPSGEYTFKVQVQYDNQTANQSTDVYLPDPPPPPPPAPSPAKRRARRKGVSATKSG